MKFMQQTGYFAVSHCHFLRHNDKLAQHCHWYAQKQCGTCLGASCLFCLVSLSLNLKYNSASTTSLRFTWGGGWTGEGKYADEWWVMVIWKTVHIEYTLNNN